MTKKILFSIFTAILLIGFVISVETEEASGLENIGNLIGNNLEAGDISAKGAELSKSGELSTLTFKVDGVANIKGILYENIKEGSAMELDSSGKLKFADLTTTKETIFNFDGNEYKVPAGNNIMYKDGKITSDIIEFKDESSDKFTKITSLGEKTSLSKSGEGEDYILEGNFKIGNNEFKSLGEGQTGKAIYSKSTGKISEIFEGTDATMDGINNKVSSGKSLKIYYEDDFDLSKCTGNCINYGKDSISLSGDGFTTDLGEKNLPFGYMNTKKEVYGMEYDKVRNLKIDLNGGNLKVSKYKTSSGDLGFNIDGKGVYTINNGRTILESQEITKLINGKPVQTGETLIFAKANYGKDEKYGSTYSYDLSINNGEYALKDNVLTNKEGYVRFNANTPWEDFIYNAKNRDKDEILRIKETIKNEDGINARDYINLVDDNKQEALVKWMYEATETANKNRYGTKISPEELFTRFMLEGGADYRDGTIVFDYDNKGPNTEVYGSTLGLDYAGDPASLKKLIDGGFVPKNFELSRPVEMTNEQYQNTMTAYFKNPKDALTAFAGELARRKTVFEKDFKDAYGEEEFNKMDDGEKYFWLTYYFNAGEGAGKGQLTGTKYYVHASEAMAYERNIETGALVLIQGKGRENVYKPWVGDEPGHVKSAQFNTKLSEGTYKLMKLLKLFNQLA